MALAQKLLAADAQFERGRRIRRGFPIHCYVGRNGTGKSMLAVVDSLPTLEQGRPVLSTVRLLDYLEPKPCDGFDWGPANVYGEEPVPCAVVNPITGDHLEDGHLQSHPLYLRFNNWGQFRRFEAGDVLMDEITGVADSSDHQGLPPEIRNKLPQLRRADIAVRITGLAWPRMNKRLREACQAVTRCKSWLPVPASSEYGRDRIFRPKRINMSATYDTTDLPVDEITEHAFSEAKPVTRSRLWIPTSPAIGAYDTFAPVDVVGSVDISGVCGYCSGTRRRHACACSDYLAEVATRKTASPQAPSEAGAGGAAGSGKALGLVSAQTSGISAGCCSDSTDSGCSCTTANLPNVV